MFIKNWSFKNKALLLMAIQIGIFLTLLVGVNIFFLRFDVTENKLFSLSPLTKEVLSELDDTIYVNAYLSQEIEGVSTINQNIRDFLRELESGSNGALIVTFPDVKAEASELNNKGFEARQLQNVSEGNLQLSNVYLGIELFLGEQSRILPFIENIETLEYDLLKLIREMVGTEPNRQLAIVANDQQEFESFYSSLIQTLQRQNWAYELITEARPLELNDYRIAWVLGHEGLSQEKLYMIDDFLMQGGSVFWQMSGLSIGAQLTAENWQDEEEYAHIKAYFDHLGFALDENIIADARGVNMPMQDEEGFRFAPYPGWFFVLSQDQDAESEQVLTQNYQGLISFWPSSINLQKEGFQSLLTTTELAHDIGTQQNLQPAQLFAYFNNEALERQRYTIAATFEGELDSFYSNTPEALNTEFNQKLDKSAYNRILIQSDVFWLSELAFQNTEQTANLNLPFFLTQLEWLLGEDDLLLLRTRSFRENTFAFEDEARRQSARFWLLFMNFLVLPLGVIILGFRNIMFRLKR